MPKIEDNIGLALFDMDGTLLPWDSQYLFSCFVVRRRPWRRLFLLFFLLCLPLYVLRIWDESRLKRAWLSYLWRLPAETVAQYGQEFAQLAQKWVYPELAERLRQYKEAGTVCVMVSASPSFYAEPLGFLLGFDAVLTTEVAMEKEMPLMPRLPRGNNKGALKVERLRALGFLPPQGERTDAVAYSDSAADLPMLSACRKHVLVHPSASLTKRFAQDSTERLFPPRPWKNRMRKSLFIARFVLGIEPIGRFSRRDDEL